MIEKIRKTWANSPVAMGLKGPNRKKILWGAGLALALVIAFFAYSFVSGQQARFQTAAPGDFQTAPAEFGILVDTVAATGSVEAGQLALLSWKTSGIVEEVNVTEGQQIARGDVLATLELSSLPETVISAQADLLEAQQALEDFYASFEGLGLAEAQKALADAQDAYETALYTYNSLLTPADDLTVEDAYAEIVFVQDALDEALKNYERLANRSQDNENRAHAVQALADAQSVYDAAVREYNALAGTATDTEVAVAAGDLAVAQATFNDAQTEYERLLSGPTDVEIAAAEAQVAAAQATLKQGLIEAPFDGVVTLAYPQLGDYVEVDEAAFELQNPTSYFVEVEINELDINQVQVGQTASVVLDALQDVTYDSKVIKVGSIGDNSTGVVNFTVIVEILEPDAQIKSGMTAVVEIETSTGEEALLIPNQAVRLEDGQQMVYILGPNGSLLPIVVSLGASSSTHSELVEGNIQPGDQIVLNPPTADIQTGPNSLFITRPAGGGGGNFQGPPQEGSSDQD